MFPNKVPSTPETWKYYFYKFVNTVGPIHLPYSTALSNFTDNGIILRVSYLWIILYTTGLCFFNFVYTASHQSLTLHFLPVSFSTDLRVYLAKDLPSCISFYFNPCLFAISLFQGLSSVYQGCDTKNFIPFLVDSLSLSFFPSSFVPFPFSFSDSVSSPVEGFFLRFPHPIPFSWLPLERGNARPRFTKFLSSVTTSARVSRTNPPERTYEYFKRLFPANDSPSRSSFVTPFSHLYRSSMIPQRETISKGIASNRVFAIATRWILRGIAFCIKSRIEINIETNNFSQ